MDWASNLYEEKRSSSMAEHRTRRAERVANALGEELRAKDIDERVLAKKARLKVKAVGELLRPTNSYRRPELGALLAVTQALDLDFEETFKLMRLGGYRDVEKAMARWWRDEVKRRERLKKLKRRG